MGLVQTNHIQAISAVYKEMKLSVFSIFRQVGIPETDCEDLVQDVFVKLLSIDTLRTETIKGITATIALRLRIDYLRRKACIRKIYSAVEAMHQYNMVYEDTTFATKELVDAELRIVSGMGEVNRKIYSLSRFEEKSYEEIAEVMQMSYRAVESRLYRSRNEVRSRLRSVACL
jgi:RNA polymerase sigma factor, sigma-70 family